MGGYICISIFDAFILILTVSAPSLLTVPLRDGPSPPPLRAQFSVRRFREGVHFCWALPDGARQRPPARAHLARGVTLRRCGRQRRRGRRSVLPLRPPPHQPPIDSLPRLLTPSPREQLVCFATVKPPPPPPPARRAAPVLRLCFPLPFLGPADHAVSLFVALRAVACRSSPRRCSHGAVWGVN